MENSKTVVLFAAIAAFVLGIGVQYKVHLLSDDHGHSEEVGHFHAEEEAHGHGHGHGHGDEKSSQMTVYDDQIEIFLEHPYLVVGKGAEFVTHVSYMQTGLPRKSGPVTFVMQQGQEKPVEHVEQSPTRDGIYIPTLTFPKPGQWKLALVVPTDSGEHRIDLQVVTVYATQQQADATPEEEGPDGISFLKEEQWIWRTLTAFVQPVNIGGSQSLAIPESCIVYKRDAAVAYVQLSGETVQERQITLGQTKDGMVEVASGLQAGERVISRSAYVIAQKEQSGGDAGHAPHGEESTGIVHLEDGVAKKHQIFSHAAGSATLDMQVSLNGQIALNSDTVAHIVPVVSGMVRQVYRNAGDTVKAGEVLAWIESRELADPKAAYLAACERHEMSQLAYAREEKLWKQKISSEQEYLQRKQVFTEARIEKRAAEQKLYAIGFDKSYLDNLSTESEQLLTKYELKAPYDGTILSKHLTLGEAIASDHDAFVIANMDTVWADFQVHGKDALLVRPGQKVVVKSETDQDAFECTLSYVSPVVDQNTRTCLARAVLPNTSGLYRPGQFIKGRVHLDDVTAKVAVPKNAIQYVNDTSCVFVKTGDGFEKRPVQLGHTTKEHVEIVAGLKPDEEVVVENAFLLKSEAEKTADAYGGHGHPH